MDLSRLFTLLESLTHEVLDGLLPTLTHAHAASRWFGSVTFMILAAFCVLMVGVNIKRANALESTAREEAAYSWTKSAIYNSDPMPRWWVAERVERATRFHECWMVVYTLLALAFLTVAICLGVSALNAPAYALDTLLGR